MKVIDLHKELKELIRQGKGDYDFVIGRGFLEEAAYKVVVFDEEKRVSVI